MKKQLFILLFIIIGTSKFASGQMVNKLYLKIDTLEVVGYSTEIASNKPLLLFIHGSPGDHNGWNKYLKDTELTSKFRMIALDRLGYGGSDGGMPHVDLHQQARCVQAFVQKYANQQKIFLIGHSVGGAVILKYLIEKHTKVDAVLLLSPTASATHEQPRWYNKLASKKWIFKNLPLPLQISQNEMMALPEQLSLMKDQLASITTTTYLFHGTFDMVAPYGNAKYLLKSMNKEILHFTKLPMTNHFIPWTKFPKIKSFLLNHF